jgi:hypothetical protein
VASRSSHARYRQAHLAGSEGRDLSASSRALADEDPLIDQAHDAGRAGTSFADFSKAHNLDEAPSLTGPPTPSSSSGASSSSSPLARPFQATAAKLSGGRTESLGSVLLGFVVAALVLSVIDYGPKGPLYWFQAKFLNEAQAGPASSSSSSKAVPPGGGYPAGPLGPLGPIAPSVTTNAVTG